METETAGSRRRRGLGRDRRGRRAVRWTSARSQRRFGAVVSQLDRHMEAISLNLERAVERSEDRQRYGTGELGLTLDLGELLRRLVEEAVAAVPAPRPQPSGFGAPPTCRHRVVRDRGRRDAPRVRPRPARRPPVPRAHPELGLPAVARGRGLLLSLRLVVPIVEDGVETGALAAYARGTAAFGPEHARVLQALAESAAPGVANARRFAEAELRALTDQLTGVRNRRGYDEELERELARSRRTGRPLSLLLVDLDDFKQVNARFDFPGGDLVLQEYADLLERAARATDTVCRRGGEEFAILLPETSHEEGRLFYARLRDEVEQAAFSNVDASTFSAGLVEWRPSESRESLDARASALVNQAKRAGKDRLETGGAGLPTHARAGGPRGRGTVEREERSEGGEPHDAELGEAGPARTRAGPARPSAAGPTRQHTHRSASRRGAPARRPAASGQPGPLREPSAPPEASRRTSLPPS